MRKYKKMGKLTIAQVYGRIPVSNKHGGPMKNKKAYTRKAKHKGQSYDCPFFCAI
jgi:hypothetical protein